MTALLTEIVNLLVGGIGSMATGIGNGLSSLVQAIFVAGEGTTASPYTLSVFGGIIVTFAAISLCVGLSRYVVNFVTSLGANH